MEMVFVFVLFCIFYIKSKTTLALFLALPLVTVRL